MITGSDRPEEIAAAALFLASGEASFVAGAELSVDGGMAQVQRERTRKGPS
jgi:NAD(P)-dependent dehydrogenase (short-subunit alcohol dehydrogenase family)